MRSLFRAAVVAFLAFGGAQHAAALDAAPAAAADRPPDEIGGPTTKELKGLHLQYKYTSGREYLLDFDADTVTFHQLHDPHAKPGAPVPEPATLPYMARKLRDRLYLVHWLNRSPTMGNIHVALIVDIMKRRMYASAIMPRGFELFDVATFEKMTWDKH